MGQTYIQLQLTVDRRDGVGGHLLQLYGRRLQRRLDPRRLRRRRRRRRRRQTRSFGCCRWNKRGWKFSADIQGTQVWIDTPDHEEAGKDTN